MADFCHLHCHTQYSLLDGAAQIQTLVERAAEFGQPAIAITDHGNLFGVPEFHAKAKKAGVRPIIGCEFYIAPAGMQDRTERTRFHQVLLARSEEGYRNLMRLSSLSYTDGYYYKPRIDKETLRAYSAGLVATTCCLQGEVPQTILRHGEEAGLARFREWLDIFGDDYFIEIQDHGIEDQLRVNEVLLRWSRQFGVPILATNDVHYVAREDHAAQDVLLCLQTGKDLYDPSRMRFENDQFYLKSSFEMEDSLARLDPEQRREALANTIVVADRCSFDLKTGGLLMPHFPLPESFRDDADGYLQGLVFERARHRYPDMPQEVVERLNYELGVIRAMGFAGYFLVVQDFTTAARDLGVRVGPGRGSAAGSLVAYCLGITDIDPIRYNLLFERFLNPERISMPDIDIDFDDRGRGKVIDYVVQKYGRENVCQIITFGTMGARSVIRDVARVLGVPLAEADRIAKLIPEGPKVSLDTAIEDVPEFKKLLKDPNEQIRNLLHYARVLEGSARHTGVHAAGVIIAPGRVSDFIPVAVAKGKTADEDVVTTQYDGKWVEDFGLLKMDFLGLKTLTVLDDALRLIRENRGVEVDLDTIPLDDPATLELFRRAETVAIFQFESSGMREWLRKLKPTSLEDLIAMNALYRPGPMDLIPNYIARKHGTEKVEYPHPMLEPVLEATYGLPVYQEQVMQMAQVMGGYSLGSADLLRRAMGKKKKEEMDKQQAIFVEGALARGVDEKTAVATFDMMAKFAGYGFNRCVVGTTVVTDAETGARRTVEELFRTREAFTVHALDEQLTLRPRPVSDVVWNGRKPVFEVRTALGHRITATGNHPLRTFDGWTNLADLAVGDRLAAPRRLSAATTATMPRSELVVLAGLLSEGNTCHPSTLYFYNNDRELVDDFVNASRVFPGTVARIYTRPNGRMEVVLNTGRDSRFRPGQAPWNKGGTAVATRLEVRSGVFRWAERLGILGVKADAKRVPDVVFTLRSEDIALFVGRLWSGDGHLCSGDRFRPYYATSSEGLARDVQHLLLRLGIPSRIGEKRFRYRGTVRPGWTVHLIGDGTLDRFLKVVGPHIVGRSRDLERLDAYARTLEPSAEPQNDVFWDRIVAITPMGEEDTYDLTVDGLHNFVADGLVVHNSHSAAYSVVAYQTAYLKAHYRPEFLAAAMTNEMGDTKKLAVVLEEARHLGVEVLPPSINRSEAHFTVENGRIRFGLGAIKGLGLGAIECIVAARATKGAFTSLFDLSVAIDPRQVNRKALESLVRAGALDEIEGHRAQMLEALDAAIQYANRVIADRTAGQNSLFGGPSGDGASAVVPQMPTVAPWPRGRVLKEERDVVGFYVSGHPLEAYLPEMRAFATCSIAEAEGLVEEFTPAEDAMGYGANRPVHTLFGIVTDVQHRRSKAGKPMGFATIEDFTGQAEVLCFSQVYDRVQRYLEPDEVVLVRGGLEMRGGVKIIADDVVPVWKVREQMIRAVVLELDPEDLAEAQVTALHELCDRNRGAAKLYFDLAIPGHDLPQRILARSVVIEPNAEFMQGLARLVGREHIRVEG